MLRDAIGAGRKSAPRVVMRTLMPVLVVTCLVTICFAQTSRPSPVAAQDLYGRFEQTRRISGIAAILKSDGTFVLVPDYGLIWRVEQPFRGVTIITKEGVRQIVNGAEVQHLEASRAPLVTHLHELLNGAMVGDWAALHNDFAVTTAGDRMTWRAVLTPLRRDDPVTGTLSSIVITGGATVDNVEVSHLNGDSEHLRFFDQTVSRSPLRPEDARLLAGKGVDSASPE